MNLKRTKKVIIFQRRSTRRFFIFSLLLAGVFSLFFSAPPVRAVEGLMNGKLLTGETDNYLLWLQTYDRNTAPYFSDRLFMDKSGNLGIGLTNPIAKLDIVGANSGSGLNLRTLGDVMIGNSAGAGIFFDGNYSYASGNYIKSVASNVQGFFTAGAERMRILANGYIGIGTTSPASTLDVNGLIKMRVVNITQPEDVINKAYLDSVVAGTTTVPTVGYWTKLNNDIYSANSGNVGIGTTSPSEKLDIAGNINLYGASRYIKFPDNTIFDFSGSNKLYITTGGSGGAARLVIDNATGNIGIGTTAPGAKLDINGNVLLSGSGRSLQIGNDSGAYIYLNNSNNNISYIANQFQFNTTQSQGFTFNGGNVGIGTTAPKNKLDVAGSMALGSYAGVNTAPSNSLIVSGNIGINSTTPNYRLSISSSTADVINVGGGFVAGLNSTPVNPDQAVPLIYLQNNYAPLGTGAGSAFVQKGNSFGEAAILGTNDNYNLNFETNNTSRLTIDTAGNVGIGTTNPLKRLTISADSDGDGLIIKRNSAGAGTYADLGFTMTTTDIAPATYLRAYRRTSYSDNDLLFHVGASDAMYIKSNGNVGIGTTNPVGNLHIKGADPVLYIHDTGTGLASTKSFIKFTESDGVYDTERTWRVGNDSDTYRIAFSADDNNGVGTYSDLFTILNTGNVGIGTTGPGANLDINGADQSAAIRVSVTGIPSVYSALTSNSLVMNRNTPSTVNFNIKTTLNSGGWGVGGGDIVFSPNNSELVRFTTGGNVGIGSTTPNIKLSVSNGSTGNVIDVGGANIGGLASTPTNPDQAVPLGYLQNNYSATSTSLWSGSLAGNISNANSGNVGIGTSSPTEKLEVNGKIKFGNNTISGETVTFDGSYSGVGMRLQNTNGYITLTPLNSGWAHIYTDRPAFIFNAPVYTTTGKFSAYNIYNLELQTAGVTRLLIATSTGNVGIGTTAPQAKAHILGTTDRNVIMIQRDHGYGNDAFIRFTNSSNPLAYSSYIGSTRNTIDNNGSGDLVFGTNNNNILTDSAIERMRITNSGNVGIGSTTPNIKLSVSNGSTGNVIDVGGANIGGLASTPTNPDQAVPLIYLQNNYNATSTSFWSGSLAGNISNANSGNVGIGITNPGAKLEVAGQTKISALGTAGGSSDNLLISNTYQAASARLASVGFYLPDDPVSTTNRRAYIGYGYNDFTAAYATWNYIFKGLGIAAAKGGIHLASEGYDTDFITVAGSSVPSVTFKASGSVGIGTTNPGSTLTIAKNGGDNTTGLRLTNASGTHYGSMYFIPVGTGATDGFYVQATREDAPLQLGTGTYPQTATMKGGNVGIGSTTPNIKLSVSNGSTGNVIDVGGANIGGLASTPTNPDQAVPLGYLQNNYNATSTSLWSGSLAGNISNANSGNVGVGTTNPQQLLHIKKSTGQAYIRAGAETTYYMDFGYNIAAEYGYLQAVAGAGPIYDDIVINPSGGSVGIGTAAPGAKLHLSGTSLTSFTDNINKGIVLIEGDSYDNGDIMAIDFKPSSYTKSLARVGARMTTNGSFIDFGTSNSYATGITNTAMSIDQSGKVGIGSTTPSIKLSVSNGSTGNVIDVGGANIGGLASTPTNPDQAVPLGYLQNNYNATSTSFWSGSLAGNISNANSGNVGIGTTNPGHKLEVNGIVSARNSSYTVGDGAFVASGQNPSIVQNLERSDGGYAYSLFYGNAKNTTTGLSSLSLDYGVCGSLQSGSTAPTVRYAYFGVGPTASYSNPVMVLQPNGNVGIGTTAPKNKLDVSGGMALGSYAGVNTAPSNSLIVSGNIGINSTTPNYRLSISSSTADVINVGGGFVSGLNSTPINRDQAIPLGYLQDNYTSTSTINSTLFWGGSLSGNIYNANTGNIGIGTTNPGTKLEVNGIFTTRNGSPQFYSVGNANRRWTYNLLDGDLAKYYYYDEVATTFHSIQLGGTSAAGSGLVVTGAGNVGIGTTTPGAYKLFVNGNTNIAGNLNVTGTTTAGAFVGTVAGTTYAANIFNGAFGSNTGNGDYGFPNRLSLNFGSGTTPLTLNQSAGTGLAVSGNLGIGTTTAVSLLHLYDPAAGPIITLSGLITNYRGLTIKDIAGAEQWFYGLNNNNNFVVRRSGASDYLTVASSTGYVGVGTTAPVEKLHVVGNNYTTGYQQTGGATYTGAGLWFGNNQTVGIYKSTSDIRFKSTSDLMSITAGGNVGIGTTSPLARLHVIGDAIVTGTMQTQTGSDFAEEFSVVKNLPAGTVVVMADSGHKSVQESDKEYDKTVVGIVSDNPSIIAGRVDSRQKVIVAMMGVVSVNVNNTNGQIEKGDLLTTSASRGYAMKATEFRPGTIIGKALENLSGRKGKIKVLVNLQ